jgi:hypothetical protein
VSAAEASSTARVLPKVVGAFENLPTALRAAKRRWEKNAFAPTENFFPRLRSPDFSATFSIFS